MGLFSFNKRNNGGGGGGGAVAEVTAENGLNHSGTVANPVIKLGGLLTETNTLITGAAGNSGISLDYYNTTDYKYYNIASDNISGKYAGLYTQGTTGAVTIELYSGTSNDDALVNLSEDNIIVRGGALQIDIPSKGLGKVLTSDAAGNATWEVPAGGNPAWELLGNTGTSDAVNFLGTTDAQKLVIKTNNASRVNIASDYSAINFYGNSVNISGGAAALAASLRNIFIGTPGNEAGSNITAIEDSIAIGADAMKNYVDAVDVGQWVAIGRDAGKGAIGSFGVVVGAFAGAVGAINMGVTAVGCFAANGGSGQFNTAIGCNSMRTAGPTGSFNTAVGNSAMHNAIGNTACTAVGNNSLFNSLNQVNNVAIGHNALRFLWNGSWNTAIGTDAGYRLTTGISNTLLGNDAGAYLLTGSRNVAIGSNLLGWQNGVRDAANDNVSIGHMAGWEGITGNWNVILGSKAANYESFGLMVSGHKNVCIGANTNGLNSGATSNIIIGHGAVAPVVNGNRGLNIGNVIYGKNMNDTDLPNGTEIADGCISIGLKIPEARLHLPAGTTTLAPLKLNSGVAPTTPADGEIWFDGTDLKMRVGGVTKTFTLV